MSDDNAAKKKLANDLAMAMTQELLRRVRDGSATAADLNVARQFLKDNDVAFIDNGPGSPVGELASSLPFTQTDEYGLPVQ